LKTLPNSKILKLFVLSLFSILFIFYIFQTWQRNYDWKDQKTLFLAAAKSSPSSVLSRSNAGAIYILEGDYERAEKELLVANQIYPYYPHAINNLGLVYRHQGKFEKAEEQFLKTLKILPNYAGAFENLGLLYLDWQKYPEAKKWLLKFLNDDKILLQQYLQIKIDQALLDNNQILADQWLKVVQQVAEDLKN